MKLAPLAVVLLGVLGAAAGCALSNDGDAVSDGQEIRELERRAVGPAHAYPAEPISSADEARYAKSKKARRELGWHVLAKALAPIKIASPGTPDPSNTPQPVMTNTVPLFRTFFGADEFNRMFAKMYGDFGKDERQHAHIPSNSEVDALYGWNAASLGPSSEADFFARVAQLSTQSAVDGLGGNDRVAFSPGYIKQYITDYPAIAKCKGKLEGLSVDTLPASDTNHSNCFSKEFAADSVVVKASWRRNDSLVPDGLPVLDTSAPAMAARIKGERDDGGWVNRDLPLVPAGPKDAYTIKLSDESGFSLVALHVMTKELRDWVWVTVWWSPNANEDFGQDRPDEIKKLGAPWDHYKMCVVTAYDELDPDPRGGFDGSLGDALAAVHRDTSWCSNGFVEKGAHNAQTNCIGCHQHAGDINELDKILVDPTKFPISGTKQIRTGFPADYSWALATPPSADTKVRLLDVVANRMASWAEQDAK